ncbi:MAG: cysteine--tRNA ligase [Coriobacteriia bacterium]|nr:cysteine--tRNA ligase [Coriobacteriia bacterium]
MRIYDTLSRRKVEFVPLVEKEVGFYTCGPTVYNHIHIGNARTFISFDVIRRYLEYSGYTVKFVQNITDVDDKIINQAIEEGVSPADVASKYTQAFVDVMKAVGIKEPTVRPKATEEIPAMIDIIAQLITAEYAYVRDGDVFYSVRAFRDYGDLSRRNIDQLLSGARVDVDERKIDAADFALWKAAKPGEPAWDSPWGMGRPGWHIECSAMSSRYLGESFDIHGGGEDLIFPHHENEIAQSKAAGNGFAKYWIHSGMLTIDAEKMSKSEGNYLLLKDVLEHVKPEALRLLMLQSHYRSPFDYSPARLEEATAALLRVENALRNLDWATRKLDESSLSPLDSSDQIAEDLLKQIDVTKARFKEQMDDDFNTASAVSAIYDLISFANTSIASGAPSFTLTSAAQTAASTIRELFSILGIALGSGESESGQLPSEIIGLAHNLTAYAGTDIGEATAALLELRTEARKMKNWTTADAVRHGLTALGLIIEDTDSGTRVFRNN